jgi:hypothetical protein
VCTNVCTFLRANVIVTKNNNKGSKMKKILSLIFAIPMMVSAYSLDEMKLVIQDPLMEDILLNSYFSPPYESYEVFDGLYDSCPKVFMREGFKGGEINMLQKDDILLSLSGGKSAIGGLIKNSGGIMSLSENISKNYLELLDMSNRPSGEKFINEQLKLLRESPVGKKLRKKVENVNKEIMSEVKNKDYSRFDFLYCFSVHAYYPIIRHKEKKFEGTLFQIERMMRRDELNNAVSTLDKASKDIEAYNSQLNY